VTIADLIRLLEALPGDSEVWMEADAGLARVGEVDLLDEPEPDAGRIVVVVPEARASVALPRRQPGRIDPPVIQTAIGPDRAGTGRRRKSRGIKDFQPPRV
jgi:hypothetical protein